MARVRTLALCVIMSSSLLGVSPAQAADPRHVRVAFQRASSGLASPIGVAFSPDGTGRGFILEQAGRVRVRTPSSGLLSRPYLDIRDRVLSGGERGLLGMAFHPRFKTNGYFFLFYTRSDGGLRISRFHATPSSNIAAKTSEVIFLQIAHSQFGNHNGGALAFRDGFLSIATGDGGSGGDPNGNAQNRASLLGKILRIDVDHACGGKRYCIPSTNPFATATSSAREILHYGLRNPWRFSYDRSNGSLWIGDAGQNAREEIDAIPPRTVGRNFGWDCREGTLDTTATYGGAYCAGRTFTPPAFQYSHSGGRCVVIGGYVYRGSIYSSIMGGLYLFADYCTGEVFGLGKTSTGAWIAGRVYDHPSPITSFGESAGGEIYATDAAGGFYHLAAARR